MLLLLAVVGCQSGPEKVRLRTGDLLFQGASDSKLSEAINKVTQTEQKTNFSHVGIVYLADGDVPFVLHASPKGGTCSVSLAEFLSPEGDSTFTVAYRIKKDVEANIPRAMERALTMLGKPYNFSYVLNDSSHYCSEFVYLAFEADSVFTMNPMTFKDPTTGEFFPTWVDFYENLGMVIPEGLPGCNPNGLAASPKLQRLGELTGE